MPITISRTSQAAAPTIQISQEQRDLLWEALLRAYLARHPETMTEEKIKEIDIHDNQEDCGAVQSVEGTAAV